MTEKGSKHYPKLVWNGLKEKTIWINVIVKNHNADVKDFLLL